MRHHLAPYWVALSALEEQRTLLADDYGWQKEGIRKSRRSGIHRKWVTCPEAKYGVARFATVTIPIAAVGRAQSDA
jgi:hypothetical protein